MAEAQAKVEKATADAETAKQNARKAKADADKAEAEAERSRIGIANDHMDNLRTIERHDTDMNRGEERHRVDMDARTAPEVVQ